MTRNGTIRRLQIVPDCRAIDFGDLSGGPPRLSCVLKFLYPLFSTSQLLTGAHLIFRVENQVPATPTLVISQPGLHTSSFLPSLSSSPVRFLVGGFRSKLTLIVHHSLPSVPRLQALYNNIYNFISSGLEKIDRCTQQDNMGTTAVNIHRTAGKTTRPV